MNRSHLPPLLVAATLAISACSSGADFEPAATLADTSNDDAAADAANDGSTRDGDTDRTDVATTGPADSAGPDTTSSPPDPPDLDEVEIDLEDVGTFVQPVDLVEHDGALFVVEQPGTIVRFDPQTGERSTALDITDRVSGGNEQGLLGLAVADGDAVLDYTDRDGTTIVLAAPLSAAGTIDLDAARTVLAVPQPFANHNAGDLAFDASGHLIVPLGDGGSGGDPLGLAHDPSTLLGSLLRIDISPGDAPYRIPEDNPFAAGGEGRPEVWAWGLRNPWKIDIDPVTGDLWIADVGQSTTEEINLVRADADGRLPARGAFFGWSAFEGDQVFDPEVPGDGAVPPVHTYAHGEDGCSISGGAVARGAGVPGLDGAFVYGDHCSGRLWAFDPITGTNRLLRDDLGGITAVRRGSDGSLYTLQLGGRVARIVAVS